jgi:hypothetical protein
MIPPSEKDKTFLLPLSETNIIIKRAVDRLNKMSIIDQIQLLVKAKLMSQDKANEAKKRYLENN